MVTTLGNDIINAYTGGVQVKEIYSFGVKVWPVTPTPGPPYDEIWYTSTSGNIVNPDLDGSSEIQIFGANILSNTYNNGVGIIKFDAPVTKISGNGVFYRTDLSSIVLPQSIVALGNYTFASTDLTSINIPANVHDLYEAIFANCEYLTSITVDPNNTVYDSRDNCNAIIETQFDCLINGCNTTVIPSTVEIIGIESFVGLLGLTSITIPSSVTTISSYAFRDCSNLSEVIVNCTVPPTLGSDPFYRTSPNLQIKVPAASLNDYLTDPGWSNYTIVGYYDEDTIDFSTLGLNTGTAYANVPFTSGDFTIEFTGSSNYPAKYYSSDMTMRVYNSGVINISSTRTIREIVFTWSGATAFRPDADYATPTGYDTTTEKWTGSSSSVVMTRPSVTGHWKLRAVKVIYDA